MLLIKLTSYVLKNILVAASFESHTDALGISVLPSAMPTIAVICVSVPNTCMGTPNVSPEKRKVKENL